MVKEFDKEYSENVQELMIELFMKTDEILKIQSQFKTLKILIYLKITPISIRFV